MTDHTTVPCNAAQLHRLGDLQSAHGPHKWIVQPGMDPVRCPGAGDPPAAPAVQAPAADLAVELEQQVRRLGLMVDEYAAGASALTDKLKRARDLHRGTCPCAKGEVPPTAFKCSMCELLDQPAAVLPAPTDRAALIAATVRACAEHLRSNWTDTWTADAARSLDLNAARIERGDDTALLRRMADEAQQDGARS